MTEMEQKFLKPDRETATAVKLFLKMHPYYYGRNARHMVGDCRHYLYTIPQSQEKFFFICEY